MPREWLCGIPEAAIQEREEEIAREERWAEFVTLVREKSRDRLWSDIVGVVYAAMQAPVRGEFARAVETFAQSEGWDGVLNATARAMRETAAHRENLLDRR